MTDFIINNFVDLVKYGHDKNLRSKIFNNFSSFKFIFDENFEKLFDECNENQQGMIFEIIPLLYWSINGFFYEGKTYKPVDPKNLDFLSPKKIFNNGVGVKGKIDILLKSVEDDFYIAISCKRDISGDNGIDYDKLENGTRDIGIYEKCIFASITGKKFNNKSKCSFHLYTEDVKVYFDELTIFLSSNNYLLNTSEEKFYITPRDPNQRYVIYETIEKINAGHKTIWWDVLCRFGKCPISIYMSTVKEIQSECTLYMTPCKTNSINEVKDWIQYKSIYHDDHTFIDLSSATIEFCLRNNIKKPFFFASNQFFLRECSRDKLEKLFKKYKIKLCIRDEVHTHENETLRKIEKIINADICIKMSGTLDEDNITTIKKNGDCVISLSRLDCDIIKVKGKHPTLPILKHLKLNEKVEQFYNEEFFPNRNIFFLKPNIDTIETIKNNNLQDHMWTPRNLLDSEAEIRILLSELFGGIMSATANNKYIPIDLGIDENETTGIYVNGKTKDARRIYQVLKKLQEDDNFLHKNTEIFLFDSNYDTDNYKDKEKYLNNSTNPCICIFTDQGRESTTIKKMKNNVIIGDTSSLNKLIQTLERIMNPSQEYKELSRKAIIISTGMVMVDVINKSIESQSKNMDSVNSEFIDEVFFKCNKCWTIHENGRLVLLDREKLSNIERNLNRDSVKSLFESMINNGKIDFSKYDFNGCFSGKTKNITKKSLFSFGIKSEGKSNKDFEYKDLKNKDTNNYNKEKENKSYEINVAYSLYRSCFYVGLSLIKRVEIDKEEWKNMVIRRSESFGIKINESCNKFIEDIINGENSDNLKRELKYLYREKIMKGISINEFMLSDGIAVSSNAEIITNKELSINMIRKLSKSITINSKILDPCCGTGTFLYEIAKNMLEKWKGKYDPISLKEKISKCLFGVDISESSVYLTIEYLVSLLGEDNRKVIESGIMIGDSLTLDFGEIMGEKKFNVVIMNPPYQAPKKNDGGQGQNGDYLWQHFVEKAFSLVKEDGYVCAIHPGGWRIPSKKYQKVFDILMENKLEYLEIHDFEDGRKTFRCTTRYDWYICKNEKGKCQTTIIDEKGEKVVIDISTLPVIPNAMIEEIAKITSNEDSKCVDFLYSRSAYGTDKKNMSQEKTGNFIYPCVYSLPQKGHQFFYSNTNQNGHFGIPKVIWSNGAGSDVIVDKNGEYGLTQFSYAIAADRNDLENIKKAIQSEKFQEICGMVKTTLDRYSKNFMMRLKKDFWKEFV